MAATVVPLEQAESSLQELIGRAERGEDIVIAEGDRPRARLIAVTRDENKKRVFGQHRGLADMRDDFDAPLPDDFWFGRYS